jgi:hypothetical protein
VAEPTSGADAPSRTAADWVADLCVYAPIGFILDAHKYVPEFAERGRSQVAMARFVGKFAVGRLEKVLGPVLEGTNGPLRSLLDGLGLRVEPAAPDGAGPAVPVGPPPGPVAETEPGIGTEAVDEAPGAAAPAASTPATATRQPSSGRSATSSRRAPASRSSRAQVKPRSPAAAAPSAAAVADLPEATAAADPGPVAVPVEAELAIPQYSTLAASQVVPRLASLDVHELAAIRRFEPDHRGRRTILNRVDQLLARSS